MQKVNYLKNFELYWMSLRYSFWGLKMEIFKLLKNPIYCRYPEGSWIWSYRISKGKSCLKFSIFNPQNEYLKGGLFFLEADFGFWTKFLRGWCRHRMITRVGAFESLQPEVTLKYLFDGHTTYRKVSTGAWSWVSEVCGVSKSAQNHGFWVSQKVYGKFWSADLGKIIDWAQML